MANGEVLPIILLVEDDADTRQLYAEFLRASFVVLEAGNGHQALKVVQDRVPALVITDFSLPGMDGFELIRQIRMNQLTEHVPVICLSGYAGRTHEQRALAAGCDRVLEKPCLPNALAQAAREVARDGRRLS